MNWKDWIDSIFACIPKLEDYYTFIRPFPMERRYRKRREEYHRLCMTKNLTYTEQSTIERVRERLQKRGYCVHRRILGEIHTFVFVPNISWHKHLFDDLRLLGHVSEFDYVAAGYTRKELYTSTSQAYSKRKEMNMLLIKKFEDTASKKPVDWFFVYASGNEICPDTITQIQERFGVPVVTMWLDDKHAWKGKWLGDHFGLQVDIAKVADLSWTSARVCCEWYLAEGGRPIYLPQGCNPSVYRPLPVNQDIQVSFVGAKYGFRASIIRFLRRYGIDVQTYGSGWKGGPIPDEKVVELFSRSKIILGMGGIGYSENLTNVKGRDFEAPVIGRGVYITSFNPDLALHFNIGKEILCYRNRDELVELIRYYLTHPDEAAAIAQAGRERCLKEHRWLHRYVKICQILGILEDSVSPSELVDRYFSEFREGASLG